MANKIAVSEVNVDLPEALYNFINFCPAHIREFHNSHIILAYTNNNTAKITERLQNMLDETMKLHISSGDVEVLKSLVERLYMINYKIEMREQEKRYQPFSSDYEDRDVPEAVHAREICETIEVSIKEISDHEQDNNGDEDSVKKTIDKNIENAGAKHAQIQFG